MKDKKTLLYLAGAFVLLLVITYFARHPASPPGRGFGDLTLKTVQGGSKRLADCSTERCLTIYVAPWCGVCLESTEFLAAFRRYLGERGVETRIIVGKAPEDQVLRYAEVFGRDTLLDPDSRAPAPGGVPNFIVSDGQGMILKTMPGVPEIYKPPFKTEIFVKLSRYLGLP